MTDSSPNGRLTAIYELQVETAEKMGNMHGRLCSIEADVSVVREGFVRQGLVLGELQATCATTREQHERRMKRQSDEINSLGGDVKEVTDVTQIGKICREEQERARSKRRDLIRWIIASLIAAGGVAVAIVGGCR